MKFSFLSTTAVVALGAALQCSAIPPGLLRSLGGGKVRRFEPSGERKLSREDGEGECRLPKDENNLDVNSTLQEAGGTATDSQGRDKHLKVCDVLGGLDVTRLRSLDTRSLFSGAMEDVELTREYLTEALTNGAREYSDVLGDLSSSLDRDARNLTEADTTLTAGLAWVDDRPDRRVERYVSESNMPHNGDKASDAAMIDAASDILPWLVDRRSKESKWNVCHRNGRSEGDEKAPLPFDNLYIAGYVLSWGDSLWYYPPLSLYGHPFNMADLQGNDFDSHDMVSGAYFTEEVPKPRDSFFYGPYADAMDPTGRAMVTAVSFVYYKGPFRGHEYQDDYIAHLGFDILLTSVSEWLSGLEGTMTPGSFAFLVDSKSFKAITISQSVVERIFPERTGMEEHRQVDVQGKPIGVDRRNQTYQVGDTIHEPLTELESAEWARLQEKVLATARGERGYEVINITITGTEEAVPHYILFDRWGYVSDWTLLVAVPKAEMENAVRVDVAPNAHSVNHRRGEDAPKSRGSFVVENKGALDTVILPRTLAPWIEFVGETTMSIVRDGVGFPLPSGSSFTVEYIIHTDKMEAGTSTSTISIHVGDDNYPDCFHDSDLTYNIAVRVSNPEQNNQIGKLAAAGWTLAGISLATSAFFAGWTLMNRETGVVRASQPIFLVLVCAGTFVMGSAIIPLGFDDGNASESGADVACMAVPWLVSMGFTISFAALFSKIWRLNKIFKSAARCMRVTVTEKDVIKPFAVLFGLNFVLLLSWSLVDPLRFVRLPVDGNDLETYGACRSEGNGTQAFGIPTLIVNVGALILACVQAYQARGISDEYSEAKYLAIAIVSWFEVMIISIPLLVIVDDSPTASYFLKSSMIFIVCMSLLLLMYLPKFLIIRKKRLEKLAKENSKSTRPTSNLTEATKNITVANSSHSSATEVGMRIVSIVSHAPGGDEEDMQDGGVAEECERLRKELAVCKERIQELEDFAGGSERLNADVPTDGAM